MWAEVPAATRLGSEVLRDVATCVVAHHTLDDDAVGGEEGPGPAPKLDGGDGTARSLPWTG